MPQRGPTLRLRHEMFRWPLLAAIALWLMVVLPRRFADWSGRAPRQPS
jgi:Ca-activated chloride channel family protein